MYSERKWLKPSEAAKILGLTARQVTNLITIGKIRAERSESGRFFIDREEITRYEATLKIHPKERTDTNPKEKNSVKLLEEKLYYMDNILIDKNAQIEFLKQQLANFTTEKNKMLDAINSHARLLEDKSKDIEKVKEYKKTFWQKLFCKK